MQIRKENGTDDSKEYISVKSDDEALKQTGFNYSPTQGIWWAEATEGNLTAFLKVFPDMRRNIQIAGFIIPLSFFIGNNQSSTPKSVPVVNDKPVPEYLMPHQKEGVLLSDRTPKHLFAYDTGTGKTATAIEIHRRHRVKTLVVVPLSILEAAWMEDIEKFTDDIEPANLWELYRKRRTRKGKLAYERAVTESSLAIINFEGVARQLPALKAAGYKMLLVDESSKCKNPKAIVTKELTKLSEEMDFVYLFSGTPAPNSLLEYYPQVRMLDKSLLGKNFYQFRNRYFYATGFGGFKWVLKKDMEQELLDKIATVTSVKKKEDVLKDLPERTDNIIHVTLSPEERKVYREMESHLITEIGEGLVTAANAAVKMVKLREISSGFIIDEGTVIDVGSSKLKILDELLDEIGNHQTIIWTQFTHEAKQISELLDQKGRGNGQVNGSITQRAKDQNIAGFKAGHIQDIIAHPRSMAHGVTAVNCQYAIYYSLSYSLEEMYQSKDRIYRYGQKNACSYYYLLGKDTVDVAVFKAVAKKQSVAHNVLEYIKGESQY